MASRARGSTKHFQLSNSSKSIEDMTSKAPSVSKNVSSPQLLKLRSIIASLRSLRNNEGVVFDLLAKNRFESDEALELMFANSIRVTPPANVGESSGVSTTTKRRKEKNC